MMIEKKREINQITDFYTFPDENFLYTKLAKERHKLHTGI